MEKEEIIKALYDANSEISAQTAHDEWLACYQSASEPDKEYLLREYHKFGEYMMKRSEESSREMQQLLAEYEAVKLAESQH